MPILGSISISSGGGSMNGPVFHEFKKQASFFLKEKIKTARLALTDVTPAQLLTEEATNGNLEGPDARNMKIISRAAFEVDDYYRIVEILHKRLMRFDPGNWRASYKALIVLEHLLTHGPERVAEEFECDIDVITEMETFHHVDDKGYNWGLNVRKKSERVLDLLKKGPLFKQERDKARKITRGIQGFDSFSHKASSDQEVLQDKNIVIETKTEKPFNLKTEKNLSFESLGNLELNKGSWDLKPLLAKENDESMMNISMGDNNHQHHPFDDAENQTAVSLLFGIK